MDYFVCSEENAYRIQIKDHILDNIYGQIGLTEVEKYIERLPIFKRLHNISQLGLVKLIFPCALHTRYTHSIGVMHIAGEMAMRINSNMGYSFFDDSDIQILRLAGMLHDVGHYPMSHNIEQAYQEAANKCKYDNESVSENLKYFVNCPDFLSPNRITLKKGVIKNSEDAEEEKQSKLEAEESFVNGFSGSIGFHHEHIGHLIISNNVDIFNVVKNNFVLINENGELKLNSKFKQLTYGGDILTKVDDSAVNQITHQLLYAIGEMVRGNYDNKLDQVYPWLEKYSAMIQIIHSDLDADNLDYLMRDATFSGTSYGLMDMSMLLNCLVVNKLENTVSSETQSKYIVGVQKKGVGCVEQFLLNKFLAYSQMILTKYVSILEAMLSQIESKHIIPFDKDYKCDKLIEMAKCEQPEVKFLAFSDYYVMKKIFNLEESQSVLAPLPKAIITNLANSSAFNLLKDSENECICTAMSNDDIINVITNSEVYKRFLNVYNKVELVSGKDIDSALEAELFSFRFETYSLTKQIPISSFLNKFVFSDMNDDRRYCVHYYRLASGIPIIDKDTHYSYSEDDDKNVLQNCLPPLCVDNPQSSIKDLYSMKYVSLRQYDVKNYEIS